MRFITVGASVLALALPAAVAGQAQESEMTDTRYRIEASDVLVVRYRYTPEYDGTLMVQPDGFISLQVVGQVKVGGLTLAEAVAAIQQQASQRLRNPEVTVEAKEFRRPRFFVGGEVGTPGEFPIRGRIGLLEAIAMAGGFKPSAKHSQVVLFRRVDGRHALRTVLNIKELAKDVETKDVELRSDDLLFVPQNRISKVASIVVTFAGPLATLGLLLNPFID